MKAAVMRAVGEPLRIEDVRIDVPGPREVLVRTVATGVCHSDLHVVDGALPNPLPIVLGHEPAGVVETVGEDVRHVAPGDHVIGCLSAFCGTCEYCVAGRPYLCESETIMRRADEPPRLSQHGEPIFNTARVQAGRTVAVIGCGGIGLSVIQGARIAGAGRIIAVDTAAWKLDLATRLGATDVVNAAEGNTVPTVVAMTSGGVDYAFEAIGTPTTVRQAVRLTRRGGTTVMIGVVPAGTNVELPAADIVLREKTILGCLMGSNRFRVDMPRYLELYRSGQLRLDDMISARLPLEGVNDALEAMRKGTAARSVIVFE
jgi:S-(hydroxymethyl)glutathione dehydrogenase / alcohol dehydrogenase